MRLLFTTILLITSLKVFSLDPSRNGSLGVISGFTYSQGYNHLRNRLDISSVHRQFYGLNITSTIIHTRSYSSEAQFQFLYNTPISSTIDGVNYKYHGHSFGIGVFGFDITPKSNTVDILIIPGINWGTNKVSVENGNSKYRNRFFALKVKTELRFNIKYLSIALAADYIIDTSRKNWDHKKGENSFSFPNPKSISILPYFSIGYRFKKSS